ncbi:MAG: hypothetical protein ACYCWN_09875 [Ferrimicrobium sp.]|jgi:hypothetical protein|uniref:Uncharacterized protein n=1 Tax=Ferrimicrobium acidiphilum TaxID=121039 RepID=A0ABV3Y407_9ACTN|nr:hypothetical protein [Ferrimicrobium sp.]
MSQPQLGIAADMLFHPRQVIWVKHELLATATTARPRLAHSITMDTSLAVACLGAPNSALM